MSSNLNNITIKDIREFGISTVEYKDFTIFATESDGEIELRAAVLYDADSDAHVSVTQVYADTLREAKESLQTELNDIKHSAGQIAGMALVLDFVGSYEALLAEVEKSRTAPQSASETVSKKPARGESARAEIAAIATEHLGLEDITFEKRGKNGLDWYIVATKDGAEFVKRLDVFKKALKSMGVL
ncbi:hypothetical protein VPFG_00253 [Vibrio phage nt-1]|uniref:Uncharacterized protein n=1 Tax=Vibrio phage nt-1 TaxID=115992 RepID=R9TJH9_9CAUD|nr:hypothetical protein VPFG_00253 [Vibrio phage nt-1]AGN30252.1 hypothetical protein VPFG_00253 [Vibrio phage nt-1]